MLNFKMNKIKSRLLLTRWAVLGCLMLAVGAVAVWGGARPEQSAQQTAANMLTARQNRLADWSAAGQNSLARQLQAHINEDAQAILPAAASLQPPTPEQQPANPPAVQTADDNKKEHTDNTDASDKADKPNKSAAANEGEVIDNAPEPWVGDELLTVEANLQQMLPPISGMQQDGSATLRGFGYSYDAAFGDYRFHSGVDLAGSLGAAVLAPLAGTVKEITEDSFMGASVVLEHEGKLQTSYFGLKPQPGLQTGQKVIAGEKLGEICAPPAFEDGTAPHLHWEIRLDGEALDAAAYGFGN